jgi:hypothetical protein
MSLSHAETATPENPAGTFTGTECSLCKRLGDLS